MMRSLRQILLDTGFLGSDTGGDDRLALARRKLRSRLRVLFRGGILFTLVALLTYFFPIARTNYEHSAFSEGTIAPYEVIAPENFKVFKNETEYGREVEAAREDVLPVLILNAGIAADRQQALDGFFADLSRRSTAVAPDSAVHHLQQAHSEIGSVSQASLRFLIDQEANYPAGFEKLRTTVRDLLISSYTDGVLNQDSEVLGDDTAEVLLVQADGERRVSAAPIRGLEWYERSLQDEIDTQFPQGTPAEIKAVYELVVVFLTPNLTYSAEETGRRREEAAARVSPYKGTVLGGERIVDKHDRVTSEHMDQLRSLAVHMNRAIDRVPYLYHLQVGAQAAVSALLVAILFVFLQVSRPAIFASTSNLVLFGILVTMPCLVASYAATVSSITPLLVPVALSVMLATVLFDTEVGLVVSFVCATLCASIVGSLSFGLIYLITGAAGAYSVRPVNRRSDFFYRSIAFLVCAYVLSTFATATLLFSYASFGEFIQKVRWDLVLGTFTACASSVLTIGLLPIFESAFSVVTTYTLLELSDLNRPLLRNLAIRAPGTYSHSIIMARLSEAAAEVVGANGLLARVGCYYHDIGKMTRPHYFIENQKGVNPHDELQPRLSALILISHVKDGVRMAEEEGLPRVIIDMISQHHGTSEIAGFKKSALESSAPDEVRDADFRYPGPRPQTREAGIVSLADAVESAIRSLNAISPEDTRDMVQRLVKGRFTAGELDECDLTLRDLTRIQEAFLPILEGTWHSRVAYPWQQEQKRVQSRRGKEVL